MDERAVVAVALGDHVEPQPVVLAGLDRHAVEKVDGRAVLEGEQVDLPRLHEFERARAAAGGMDLDAGEDDDDLVRAIDRRVTDSQVEPAHAVAAAAAGTTG